MDILKDMLHRLIVRYLQFVSSYYEPAFVDDSGHAYECIFFIIHECQPWVLVSCWPYSYSAYWFICKWYDKLTSSGRGKQMDKTKGQLNTVIFCEKIYLNKYSPESTLLFSLSSNCHSWFTCSWITKGTKTFIFFWDSKKLSHSFSNVSSLLVQLISTLERRVYIKQMYPLFWLA